MSRRRAAFFLLRADYFGRTFEDTILRALDDAGFDVDVFAPGGAALASGAEKDLYPHVTCFDVDYRRAWLQRAIRPGRWRAYDVFLGSADLPMAFAGTLAGIARRPVVTVCDEIFLGGYEGHATPTWKGVVRWAMRKAAFTIITDPVRIPLQREYADLPASHEFVPVPCCYSTPYDSPAANAASAGVFTDYFTLSCTGTFASWNGVQWAIPLAGRDKIRLLVQTGGRPDAAVDALLARAEGIVYRPERLSWRDAAALTATADASFVCYLSPFPQFRVMGVSSQKLCTSLWLGLPVIASRQESFAFVEELGCGVLIDSAEQLPAAIARIRGDAAGFAARALAAVDTYIRPAEKRRALAQRFAQL